MDGDSFQTDFLRGILLASLQVITDMQIAPDSEPKYYKKLVF